MSFANLQKLRMFVLNYYVMWDRKTVKFLLFFVNSGPIAVRLLKILLKNIRRSVLNPSITTKCFFEGRLMTDRFFIDGSVDANASI